MKLSEMLKEHRAKFRLSEKQMADMLSVSRSCARSWEQGHEPHLVTIEGCAARLKRDRLLRQNKHICNS